jgi:SulP family sulfate permease
MKKFFSHIKQDLPASIVVFFVALPLCLGIALASGAPLFSGIIAGVVGGVLVGALSGSPLGVSGPAAGLSVVVLGYLATLGGNWEAFLMAVVLCGVIQVIGGFLKLGTIARYFPDSVIKGMLTGIGLIIILKQIPHAIGYNSNIQGGFNFEDLDRTNTFFELSHILNYITLNALIIASVSMLILILWDKTLATKHKIFKAIPSPLIAVIAGITLGKFLDLHETQIVKIPVMSNFGEFIAQFSTPDFSQILNPQILSMAFVMAIIASLETLLCVEAADNLDPQKRVTPTNRELKAQGFGNIISGLIGGLPITQVVARSSANVSFGAKTKLSTISHGFLLLISAIAIPDLLNMIPLSTLACVLLVIGYKLAQPKIFQEMYYLGRENFIPFIATILGMLVFDLLTGVGIGVGFSAFFLFRNNYHSRNVLQNAEHQEIAALTREARDSLSPAKAVRLLKEGNKRFVSNLKLNRNLLQQINETSVEQHPFAFVLSCIDSRTSAELIFDQGLGDVFSCRIAGNVLNDDILGSMEFACKIAGAKLIMILGHTGCGAIKGACNNIEMGKLTGLLNKVKPSVKAAGLSKTSKEKFHDLDFVEKVSAINVERVAKQVLKESAVLNEMHKKGKIALIGGMYNVTTGVVDFY